MAGASVDSLLGKEFGARAEGLSLAAPQPLAKVARRWLPPALPLAEFC